MWTLLVGAAFVASVYYSAKSIGDYFDYDYITNIKIIADVNVQFPTVTICKYNDEDFEFKVLNFVFNQKKINLYTEYDSYNDSNYGKCYRINSVKNIFNETRTVWTTQSSNFELLVIIVIINIIFE